MYLSGSVNGKDMDQGGGRPIQSVVKEVCSISYVSEKLQVSRPSLYKYMELYDAGEMSKIPDRVLAFFRFLTSSKRSEDDTILYFINEGSRRSGPSEVRSECLTGGGRAMITFPGIEDPTDVVVEVLMRGDSGFSLLGEYRPEPGMRFVTIGNLVPDHTFYYRIRTSDGVQGEPRAFSVER